MPDTNTNKLNIAVLMGGPSLEHKISIDSGINVLKHLDKSRYNILPVIIDRKTKWQFAPAYFSERISNQLVQKIIKAENSLFFNGQAAVNHLVKKRPDVVFLALHGEYGEDGTIQKLLGTAGLNYTGSNLLASALGMDKPKSLAIFKKHRLPVPNFIVCDTNQWPDQKDKILRQLSKYFKYPLVIKPSNRGSSLGVSIATNLTDLNKSIAHAFDASDTIMLQQHIKGREITCAVLDQGPETLALPPTEIIPLNNSFFNYQAKYQPKSSKEITPANLSCEVTTAVQNIAIRCHHLLNCRGLSRTDLIIEGRNQIYILEINTLPGLTKTSLAPQAAAVAGISFSQLLDKIIANAIKK